MPSAPRTAEEARAPRDLGYKVRQAREARGMTQVALAEASALHYTYIGQVENGRRNLALLNVYALARALGVRAADLLAE